MANPKITLVGGVVRVPELKFTPSGAALCTFTVVTKDRTKDGDEWVDKDPTFIDVAAWRRLAENIAESDLQPGQEVVVEGVLKQHNWETTEGEKRSKVTLDAKAVGVSLSWNSVRVVRPDRAAASSTPDPFTAPADPFTSERPADDQPPF